ncbi:uncharacterized protein OCT59_020814 [Rhizophagus irregularis]|uniref:uncharacterized protein n=1 Tax=Rhizophagus irregularis TaxID=588596 RepID=UPI00332C702A|nr:hypothetical protein OCT59_020814 [Rhizophagus irregularis]
MITLDRNETFSYGIPFIGSIFTSLFDMGLPKVKEEVSTHNHNYSSFITNLTIQISIKKFSYKEYNVLAKLILK